jgi:acetylglutamate kinase
MSDMRATIVRLLSNMASAREIHLYLKRFSQLDASRFAVVRVGGAVLRDELDALVSSLAFLQQVGLTPIVIHGPGPQLDEELSAEAIDAPRVGAVRYTSPEALAVVRRVLQRVNLRLVEALQASGVRATSIQTGVFEAEYQDREKYGLVGSVVRVHTDASDAAIAARSIPVIASLGETAGGQLLTLQTNSAADALVKRLAPYKVIFLNQRGGIFDRRGRRIESISLSAEYADLIRQPWLDPTARAELVRIHDLLMQLPPATSLSITRPDEMAKELFTHRGSGTLIRRGERIDAHASWEHLDRDRLRALIESSFGRALTDDYFNAITPLRVYCSEHYRAALVLTLENGLPYLDKFAVNEEAQGEGLGRAIWQVMRGEYPQLFWRSRRGNAVNEFYFANADGAMKDDTWVVFWYGISDWGQIRFAVEHARARPATLV